MGANYASQLINISTFLEVSAAVFWFILLETTDRQVQCVQQTLYIIHENEHFDCKR